MEFKLPNKVFIPGDTISEMLEELSMSQKDLAARMDLSEITVSEIIQGKLTITNKYANDLEMIFGLPCSFWLHLQRTYEYGVKDL